MTRMSKAKRDFIVRTGRERHKAVRAVEDLMPHVRNSRKHEDWQVAKIAASIVEFGWMNPVLVDSDGTIIAGHARIMAALKLDLPEAPVIDVSDLSAAQLRAYMIADNQLPTLSSFDERMLASEVLELRDELGFDVSLLGFDDIDAVLRAGETTVVPPSDGGDADKMPPAPARCARGDLWLLGRHRILCGDSSNVLDIDRLLGDEKVDLVLTDPPYGISFDGQSETHTVKQKHKRKAHEFRDWDSSRPDAGVFNFILALKVPTVIFGGNYFADLLPASRGWIYWSKGQDGALRSSDGELAWTNLDKPLRAVTVNRAALAGSVHPTQKPVSVFEFCLEYVGKAEKVLDLFLGSGSTLIACERSDRRCFGMDIDPKYCDAVLARWEEITGKKAELSSLELYQTAAR